MWTKASCVNAGKRKLQSFVSSFDYLSAVKGSSLSLAAVLGIENYAIIIIVIKSAIIPLLLFPH